MDKLPRKTSSNAVTHRWFFSYKKCCDGRRCWSYLVMRWKCCSSYGRRDPVRWWRIVGWYIIQYLPKHGSHSLSFFKATVDIICWKEKGRNVSLGSEDTSTYHKQYCCDRTSTVTTSFHYFLPIHRMRISLCFLPLLVSEDEVNVESWYYHENGYH